MKRLLDVSITPDATAILVVLSSLLLILVGCKKDDSGTNPPPVVYEDPDTNKLIQPLNKTSIWSVSRTIYNSNGSVNVTVPVDGVQFTRDSLVAGSTWYFSFGWYYWFYHGTGGVWWKPADNTNAAKFRDSARSLVWKWPAKLNDTYSCVMYGIPSTARVVSLNHQISIQGRFLNCVGYEYRATSGNTLITTMYLFPGVGWLVEEAHIIEFNTSPYYELTSYLSDRWWVTSYFVNP